MNKKLVPLLGIAFVVAVICTGVFYGLFAGKLQAIADSDSGTPVVLAARNLEPGTVLKGSDLRVTNWRGSAPKGAFSSTAQAEGATVLLPVAENEPVTPGRVASGQGGGGGLAVPSGLRAVSIHVHDSAGVLELVSAGQKVDVQMVLAANDGQGQLRTILQDAPVLSRSTLEGGKPAVVTLLATPGQADLLALADATARLRLTLRNPLDKDKPKAGALSLASLLRTEEPRREAPVLERASAPRERRPVAVPSARRVQFNVRIFESTNPAAGRFVRWMSNSPNPELLEVATLKPDFDAESELRGLKAAKDLQVVSASAVTAANNREASVQAADTSTAVRLRLVPAIRANNRLSLRVLPEVVSSGWSRKIDTEVELVDGQSFLVTGLSPAEPGARSLVMLVTPRLEKPVDRAALE
jgi:Flp pilus assembly protein CpaB